MDVTEIVVYTLILVALLFPSEILRDKRFGIRFKCIVLLLLGFVLCILYSAKNNYSAVLLCGIVVLFLGMRAIAEEIIDRIEKAISENKEDKG